jgi:hypothetical protein
MDVDILLTGPGAAAGYHMKRISVKLLRRMMLRFARSSGYL